MSEVWVVQHGEYADAVLLAVFDSSAGAHEWADRWNLAHLGEISSRGDAARVDGRVPFNPQEVS